MVNINAMKNNKKFKVLGIVAEYDPFHNGHLKQLTQAKELYNADFVVVVMSGPFLQRGTTSLFSVEARTKMALNAGADFVFELPNLFALSDAERFAFGGINILKRLNFVNALSFGCESKNINDLNIIANYLSKSEFENYAINFYSTGVSYAKARSMAIEKGLGKAMAKVFSLPNNILGICYLKAINELKANFDVIAINRATSYHSLKNNFQSPSAKLVREYIKNGNLNLASKCIPKENTNLFFNEIINSKQSTYSNLDEIILFKIRNMSAEQLAYYPGIAEGLNNKIKKEVERSTTLNELIENVKSKRFTYSRLSRLFAYILLNIDTISLNKYKEPEYVRLLGFNTKASALFKYFKNSKIPIITSASKLNNYNIENDKNAYDVWSLSAQKPPGGLYNTKMIKVNR